MNPIRQQLIKRGVIRPATGNRPKFDPRAIDARRQDAKTHAQRALEILANAGRQA